MAKIELSLSKDYVSSWNYVDAVRELFQNALDQQTVDPSNKLFFKYDEKTKELFIGNKISTLTTETLLLGATTKANDEDLIGKFGEGYKISTLVLTRENHPVTFYNYGNREVWRPRFTKSSTYGGQEVLTFYTRKQSVWRKVPNHDLTIKIENISKKQYEEIVSTNLHLQEIENKFVTRKGNILTDERFKGKIYVNGLFVCNHKDYHYGYDFKPRELELDRDRKLVSDFDLRWLASEMWVEQTSDEMRDRAVELVKIGAEDVRYLTSVRSGEGYQKISDDMHTAFVSQYGKNAVPVSTQEEVERVTSGYVAITVDTTQRDLIKDSMNYEIPEQAKIKSPKERLVQWLIDHRQSLSNKAIAQLESIMEQLD